MSDRRLLGLEASPGDLRDFAVRPLLPRALRGAARRWLSGTGGVALVSPELAARVGLPDRPEPLGPAGTSFEVAAMVRWAQDGCARMLASSFEAACARSHLERRAPLHDRRLVELALGVPRELRWGHVATKTLVRRALQTRLPGEIVTRRDKADFSHVVAADVSARAVQQTPPGAVLAQRGWADGPAVSRFLERFARVARAGDPDLSALVWTAWFLFAISEWAAGSPDARP